MTWTRRRFLETLALSLPAVSGLAATSKSAVRAVLLIPPAAPGMLVRGAEFGAAEAERTASLFSRAFVLDVVGVTDAAAASREAGRFRREGATVIAGGLDAAVAAALIDGDAPLVVILRRDQAEAKVTGGWRITPTAVRYAEARDKARARFATEKEGSADPQIVAWHPRLRRYGAGELNERFTAETGAAMNEDAWFGWIAVKLIVESSLRKREVGATRLDGHKGVLLSFDGARRLQQPLYAVVERDGEETVFDV